MTVLEPDPAEERGGDRDEVRAPKAAAAVRARIEAQDQRRRALASMAPVTTTGNRSASIASSAVVVGFGILLAVALVGKFAEMSPRDAASRPAPTTGATTGAAVAASFGPTPAPPLSAQRTVLPLAGYEVDYAADATHRPMIFDDGAVAVYGFGPQSASGTDAGEINVSVGSPAHGAAVLSHSGYATIYADTTPDLVAAYLRTSPGEVLATDAEPIGGSAAVRLSLANGPAGVAVAVFAVHGNRAFVLTAAGFSNLDPADPVAAAEAGLTAFLAGFRFTMPLFVSRDLGFQVPQPVAESPAGYVVSGAGEPAIGAFVFPDGRGRAGSFTHSITVSVGTRANPALVRVPTGPVYRTEGPAVWAGGLVELQAAYVAAAGGNSGSARIISIGGELALVIDHPGDVAAAALVVHEGRVYIITTTGAAGPDAAPDFDAFLAGFAFLN